MLLTRYELAKVVGIRSLQLSEGESCKVHIPSDTLSIDFLFMAALELKYNLLDVCVQRGGETYHISSLTLPAELDNLLLSRGGEVYREWSQSSSTVKCSDSAKSLPNLTAGTSSSMEKSSFSS